MNQINHEGLEVHKGKYADLHVLCVLRGEGVIGDIHPKGCIKTSISTSSTLV